MADDKEQARRIGEALMVCKYPDVCKSPAAPVPYMIVANFSGSQLVANSVNATSDPTFTQLSYIQGVIGNEGGTGGGVCSGVHAGGGACWAADWSHTVRAEGQFVVRNTDPTLMNGQPSKTAPNTQGTVVYTKGAEPKGGVGPDGKPTEDTNPRIKMKITQYGYKGDLGDPGTDRGVGIQERPLVAGESVALSPSAVKALGVKPGDWIKIESKSGTQIRRYVDRTSAKLKDHRVDLYNPDGYQPGLDGPAMVSRTTKP